MREIEDHVRAEAAAGRVVYQHCPACGHDQALARPFCTACSRSRPEWRMASGGGTIAALTVLHRAPAPAWKDRLPYAIALVDLDEGLRVMAHADPALAVGQVARLRPSGAALPFFEPAEAA